LCLVLIHISVYYALLLILLPLLRKIISARACATLWLVPSVLYFFIWLVGSTMRPLFVITLPRRILPVILIIWACGFAGVMIRQLVSHILFRRELLRVSSPLEDAETLEHWERELMRHGIKAKIPVLESDEVTTPLTIGCFDGTMRLILPKRGFSVGELELIFRHELRHIIRCDTRAKLFLGFCAAMCWFNPLAWIARRRVADDLELSCDEAILAGADESTRKSYADLLLDSAGTGRGFTTCLSAAAGTLRYRLRNVIRPARRFSGGAVVGFAVLALIVTFGSAALADSPNDVRSVIFDAVPSNLTIDRVSVDNLPGEKYSHRVVYGYDAEALTEYISSLTVRRVYAGNYTEGSGTMLYVDYIEAANGEAVSFTRFQLCDGLMFVNIPYDDLGAVTYLLDDDIDWDYILSLLDFDAENSDPSPQQPELTVTGISESTGIEGPLYAAKRTVTVTDSKGTWVAEYSEDKTTLRLLEPGEEIDSVHWLYDIGESGGGIFGTELDTVQLGFSYAPSEYSVLVESWDRSESYTITSADIENGVLPLAPYSTHYTVSGSFDTVKSTHYEMKFYFDIGLPADSEAWELQ
ncbi:MAG: M56 family metallopeptidase, partial [Oscillospiraceae bacterium]|nr:M56 family metallopeptidase [Oscillospiraceae bacterium]